MHFGLLKTTMFSMLLIFDRLYYIGGKNNLKECHKLRVLCLASLYFVKYFVRSLLGHKRKIEYMSIGNEYDI